MVMLERPSDNPVNQQVGQFLLVGDEQFFDQETNHAT